MLLLPQKGIIRCEHNTGSVGSATLGTAVTTGTPAATKGTAVQLIASTSFDAYWITVIASDYGQTTTASAGALDILVGAATEEVLIPNLLFGYCGGGVGAAMTGPKRWDFPLYIPAGTRIAAQTAGSRIITAVDVAVYLYGGNGYPPYRTGTKVTTYGMGTVPFGTAITVGASGGEGGWTEMTSSTSEDHFAFAPSFQVTSDTSIQNRNIAIDLGVGSATEEQIMESYWFQTSTTEMMGGPHNTMPCFQDVPSGSRLVMRASNSGTNDAGYNCVIHAVS